jgi:hypothetical protein
MNVAKISLGAILTPDKIRAEMQSYASTLKYYGERFVGESIRRAARSKTGKDNGSNSHG